MAQNKKRLLQAAAGMLIILAAVAVVAAFAVCNSIRNKSANAENAVLVINGEAVSEEEYKLIAEKLCNEVYRMYSTEEVNQKEFWTTEIRGTAPWEYLDKLVKEELIHNYIIKEYAVEYGITEQYTYTELLQYRDRKSDYDAETPDKDRVYGLQDYDDLSYYQNWYSNLETQVVNALIDRMDEVTEEDCRLYYKEHSEEYTYETGVSIIYAEIPEKTSNPRYSEAMAEYLKKSLETDAAISQLAEQYPEVCFEELELNSFYTGEEKNGNYSLRWQAASQMDKGEVYGPYEDNGKQCLIKCVGRTDNGLLEFDEVKGRIQRLLQVQNAGEILAKTEKEAKITSGNISAQEIISKQYT